MENSKFKTYVDSTELQMLSDLEAARQFSEDHNTTVYAASNGSEIIWSDSRSQVIRGGFWIASIFVNGRRAEA